MAPAHEEAVADAQLLLRTGMFPSGHSCFPLNWVLLCPTSRPWGLWSVGSKALQKAKRGSLRASPVPQLLCSLSGRPSVGWGVAGRNAGDARWLLLPRNGGRCSQREARLPVLDCLRAGLRCPFSPQGFEGTAGHLPPT